MPSMPCVFIAAAWSDLSRSARRPPWTLGCRVFARPSIISGKSVISETSSTVRPASRSALAVPPVEISVTPWAARPWAKSSNPVLSDTESRAREILRSIGDSWGGGVRPLLALHEGIEKGQHRTCTQRICDGNQIVPPVPDQVVIARNPVQIHLHDPRRQQRRAARQDDQERDQAPHQAIPMGVSPSRANRARSSVAKGLGVGS